MYLLTKRRRFGLSMFHIFLSVCISFPFFPIFSCSLISKNIVHINTLNLMSFCKKSSYQREPTNHAILFIKTHIVTFERAFHALSLRSSGLGFPFIVDSTMTLMASNWFPNKERATYPLTTKFHDFAEPLLWHMFPWFLEMPLSKLLLQQSSKAKKVCYF